MSTLPKGSSLSWFYVERVLEDPPDWDSPEKVLRTLRMLLVEPWLSVVACETLCRSTMVGW